MSTNRYFIFDLDDMTLRAAQPKQETAARYLTAERFMIGPITYEELEAQDTILVNLPEEKYTALDLPNHPDYMEAKVKQYPGKTVIFYLF